MDLAGGGERSGGARGHGPLPSAHVARLQEVGAGFLRARPLVTGPAMVVALFVLAATPLPDHQRNVLFVGFAAMFSFFAAEAAVLWKSSVREGTLFRSLLITAAGLTLACMASGALRSPFLPLLFAPTVTAFAAFGRTGRSTIAFAILVGALVFLAVAPTGEVFPPLPQPQQAGLLALFAGVSGVLLRLSVARLSDAYQETSARLARAHEDVLAGAEARAQALEAVGAKVAHEIKNPLAAVKGLVELLAREPRDERSSQRFAVVQQEVERIEELVRDYLTFSRPLQDLRPDRLDIGALLGECCGILEARAARAGVGLSLAGDRLGLDGDPRRLKEAFLNLLGNAVEATPPGGAVRIAWTEGGGVVRIDIRDSGPGMSGDTLARIGTPFFTTRSEGTGLGVALAKAVIALHGGELRYESGPGGTSTVVELPRSLPLEPPHVAHPAGR